MLSYAQYPFLTKEESSLIVLICAKIYGIVKAFLNATTQLLLYNRMVHNNILCGERKINPTRQITNKMR